MFKTTRITQALVLAFGGSLAMGATVAQAQSSSEPQRIEIVGSNVKRIAVEGPSPVQVISREEIERSGANSVTELLQSLAISSASQLNESSTGGFSAGGAGVNLRGLGLNTTLTLLNGRRISNYAFAEFNATFADLNSLPLAAVERVEILKDGASAIYGSDAIAGVVNVVLRKDFTGGEIGAQIADTTKRDNLEKRVSLLGGIGDRSKDGYNVMASFEFFDRPELKATARSFSNSADKSELIGIPGYDFRSSRGNPGYLIDLVTGQLVTDPACPPDRNFGVCVYDFAPDNNIINKAQRMTGALFGTVDLSPTTSLFGEFMLARGEYNDSGAPTPITLQATGGPFVVPAAFSPTGNDAWLVWRTTELGPRVDEVTSTSYRAVAGISTTLGAYEFDTALTLGGSKVESTGTGYVSASALRDALADGSIVFWNGATNTPAALASITGDNSRDAETKVGVWDARLRGDIMDMAGGPMGFAVGLQYQKEELTDTPSVQRRTGDIEALTAQDITTGDRSVASAYAELVLPIAKSFEAQLALRTERYSDFGNTTNPKLALKWTPTKEFALRASVGTGFRAPTLVELNQGSTTSFPVAQDPLRCPVTGAADDCLNQLTARSVGNPNLEPEESTSFNVGFIFEPMDSVSLSLDYFSIDYKKVISQLGVNRILAGEAAGDPVLSALVERLPATAQDIALGIPGRLIAVNNAYLNLNGQKLEGIDLSVDVSTRLGDGLKVRNALDVTHYTKNEVTDDLGNKTNLFEFVGSPRTQAVFSSTWETGPWEAVARLRHIGRQTQLNFFVGNVTYSESTLTDVRVSYRGFAKTVLTLGVNNLFDKTPPVYTEDWPGYLATQQDPRGRMVYVNARYEF